MAFNVRANLRFLPNLFLPLPSKKKFEIVVARYKEHVGWSRWVWRNCTIYSKDEYSESDPQPGHIILPNKGREAGTYLYHIISRYDSLAERTLFLQGNPFDHKLMFLRSYWKSPENFTATYLQEIPLATFDVWWTKNRQKITEETMRGFLQLIDADPSAQSTKCTWGAQFAVSRELILQQPRSYYERLWQISQQDSLEIAGRTFNNHHIAYLFELFWWNVFNKA